MCGQQLGDITTKLISTTLQSDGEPTSITW